MTTFAGTGKTVSYDSSDSEDLTCGSEMSYAIDPLFGEAVVADHASDFDLAAALQPRTDSTMTLDTPVSQTISPQDLMFDDWAPDSTPSSFLETPGNAEFDSPDTFIPHSTDPSPFMDHTLDFPGLHASVNHFPSLDDIEQQMHAAAPVRGQSHHSPAMQRNVSTDFASSPMSRDISSGSKRPAKADARVTKRSRGPLPPIKVDDATDTVAVKRCRNTLAARKSRAKRQQHVEELEDEVERLTRELEYWRNATEQCADPNTLAAFQRRYTQQSDQGSDLSR